MPQTSPVAGLKEEVREFWNADPCGSRYLGDHADFEAHARARYQLEPYIHEFAGFAQSAGQRVLEVGSRHGRGLSGMVKGWSASHRRGSFQHLNRAGEAALRNGGPHARSACVRRRAPAVSGRHLRRRLLLRRDAPQPRHSAMYPRSLASSQARRRASHHDLPHASLTGFMLWLRYGFLRGSLCVSPFAITWKVQAPSPTREKKARTLLQGSSKLSCGKLQPRRSAFERTFGTLSKGWRTALVWRLYPRFLVRRLGARWGLFLLISARNRRRRKDAYKFCSHQRCSTNRDHGRDQEVSPARKRFQTFRTAPTSIEV